MTEMYGLSQDEYNALVKEAQAARMVEDAYIRQKLGIVEEAPKPKAAKKKAKKKAAKK